ncbi:bacteriophage Gp15 family protein [Eubacteriales bacterium OttesenSCG-928-K08]|nr:bacteriophage Gp15 family protein [Eubacteriales bacterium OttesenSCG-928-K08]
MIARRLPQRIVFEGKTYRIKLYFPRVLRLFEMMRDDEIPDMVKLREAVGLLAGARAKLLPTDKQARLYKEIFDQFIVTNTGTDESIPRALDFSFDAPYIYAAFLQAYQINLTKQRKLDWRLFMALLRALPEGTKMREIISVRTRPIPTPTKYNADEILNLQRAKATFAIPLTDAEAAEQFQRGLDRMVDRITALAKAGEASGKKG